MKEEPDPTQAKIQTNLDSRPTPDPTVLTTQMLQREISAAREILETRMHCIEENADNQKERLDARGTAIAAEVGHLRVLVDEKFERNDLQFSLIEKQRVEQKSDTKAAVDAALTAQKEAVKEQTSASERAIAKSEAATTKNIDQQGVLIQTTAKATDEKIADLKDRLTIMEGRANGSKETVKRVGDNSTLIISAIVALVAIAALLVSILR